MSTAIVVGATGILGAGIVRHLSEKPDKWKKVYALSRTKKFEYPSTVVHSHIDLLASADEMAEQLQQVEGEYVFYAAYTEKNTEEEQWKVNGDMLENFLNALERTGAITKTKRILLVNGTKQYGVHLGQAKNPMVETDPWLRDAPFPPNFYYRQQDTLRAFCERHSHTSWTVTYPSDVIGFAQGNFMNLATSLGIYAAVSKELGSSSHSSPTDLVFPGSETIYTSFETFTASTLHAAFCEWAVREPRAAGQAFNVVNGDAQSWQDLWPRLARRFGMKVKRDQFAGPPPWGAELAGETALPCAEHPPIRLVQDEIGLAGEGRIRRSELEPRVCLVKWSKQEEVKLAWARLAEREGLQKDALDKGTWAFADWVLGRNYAVVASMSKAREAGWTGYQDTWKAFSDVFGELEAAKVLPKTH